MKPQPAAPAKPSEFFRLEQKVGTTWSTVAENVKQDRLRPIPGVEMRILRVWHDKAHRRHFEEVWSDPGPYFVEEPSLPYGSLYVTPDTAGIVW